MKKITFIGAGNMATAFIAGVLNAGVREPADITATGISAERLDFVAKKYGINTMQDNPAAASQADIIFIVVKPYLVTDIIKEIKSAVKPDAIIVNIAAGITLGALQEQFGDKAVKLINTMPNTPAMVNEGITAVCPNPHVTPADMENVTAILSAVGKTVTLPESQFGAYTGLAGSSPAYAYMFIEAMADAGVKHGLPRDTAITVSAQALLGAAKMVLQTAEHPAKLKDAVCSPNGTTIEAVSALEREGFRNAVISAIDAVVGKFEKMKKASNI